jgi:hypothetical protein
MLYGVQAAPMAHMIGVVLWRPQSVLGLEFGDIIYEGKEPRVINASSTTALSIV